MTHSPFKMQAKPNKSPMAGFFLPSLILSSVLFLTPQLSLPLKAEDASRYTMIETENGIIRLDKQTGAMSNCQNTDNSWTCQPIINNEKQNKQQPGPSVTTGEKEKITALELENMKLKQRLADLEHSMPNPDDNQADPESQLERKKLKLPSEEEVDEAITYMEKMIRKFGGAMKRLQEEQQKEPHTEL